MADAVVHPGTAFTESALPSRVTFGLGVTLVVGVAYALVAAGLAVLDHEPMVAPWLRISPDNYYRAQVFFTVPVVTATVMAGAAVFHVVSQLLGGRASFNTSLNAVALAYALPTLLTWSVEATSVSVILLTPVTTDQWLDATATGVGAVLVDAYQYLAFAWYALLFGAAGRFSQRLSLGRSAAVAVSALTTIGLLQFTFIR
jgi:hypothetical protein